MKKYLLLMLTLLLCVSLFSCGFDFNEEFIFGEPEVPTAPPQPPISKMEPDVMMHVLNEKGVVFENYDPITEQKIIQMMLTILENDPDTDINIPEKYSKQFEQMRGIVRERGSASHKGFEMTMMSDKELLDILKEKMDDVYKEFGLTLTEDNIFANRLHIYMLEKDINYSNGYSLLAEVDVRMREIVKEYHGIE